MTHPSDFGLPEPNVPSAICYLDETGVVATDRFFAVGVIAVPEASDLLLELRRLRDRLSWRGEWHFTELSGTRQLPVYEALVDVLARQTGWIFNLAIDDREVCDAAMICGDRYLAYERIACQALHASRPPGHQIGVLADEYSTPDHIRFERDVRASVNLECGVNAVASVARVSSNCNDLMQAADLLTSASVFPYRRAAGLAGHRSPKSRLADYVDKHLGSRLHVDPFDPRWLRAHPPA